MLLHTERLSKMFQGLTAVRNVDLCVNKGTIHAVIGPNGAGKTTLFHLLSGFYKPTSGKVFFAGSDVTNTPPDRMARLGVARTFQTTNLFSGETVLDNLIIGHRLRTKSGLFDAIFHTKRMKNDEKRCREKALEALQFVEVEHLADRPVNDISQEAQKRVALALALASEPQLLLLDEPAGGINPHETEGLSRLIKKMKENGLTICLIEHKMEMVMNLADEITVLNHGEKIASGTPKQVQENEAVLEAYLGRNDDARNG